MRGIEVHDLEEALAGGIGLSQLLQRAAQVEPGQGVGGIEGDCLLEAVVGILPLRMLGMDHALGDEELGVAQLGLDVAGEAVGAEIAIVGILGETFEQALAQGLGKVRVELQGVGGLGVEEAMGHVGGAGSREGQLAGQSLEEDDAHGEDVGAAVDGSGVEKLFRGHVVESAEHHLGLGDAGGEGPAGHAEVGDLELSGRRDQAVGGFDVAVDHSDVVEGLEGVTELKAPFEDSGRGGRSRSMRSRQVCPGWYSMTR